MVACASDVGIVAVSLCAIAQFDFSMKSSDPSTCYCLSVFRPNTIYFACEHDALSLVCYVAYLAICSTKYCVHTVCSSLKFYRLVKPLIKRSRCERVSLQRATLPKKLLAVALFSESSSRPTLYHFNYGNVCSFGAVQLSIRILDMF